MLTPALVALPPLLATLFRDGWMPLGAPTDDRARRTLSAIFFVCYFCSEERRLWGSPQFKIMSSNFDEK